MSLSFRIKYLLTVVFIIWTLKYVLPGSIGVIYDYFAYVLLSCIIAWQALPAINRILYNENISPANKSVVITGCDTGFGHELAKRLDSRGFQVFAGCLFPSGDGAKNLKDTCSNSLHIIGLDVTKDDSVQDVLNYVRDNLNGSDLWALVNNAGISTCLPIEFSTIKDFQDMMDVNAIGVVRVTKSFLPLIRHSKGRIVTVTSLAGRFPQTYVAGYTMSKYAATAFCEILRQEIYPYGVRVITIEPEAFSTPLANVDVFVAKTREFFKDKDQQIEEYGRQRVKDFEKSMTSILKSACKKVYKVIDSVEDAVCNEEPFDVYKPRRNVLVSFICFIMELLPLKIGFSLAEIAVNGFEYLS